MFLSRDQRYLDGVLFDNIDDFKEALKSGSFMITDGSDVVFFEKAEGGFFAHCWFRSRGRAAIAAGKAAIETFFTETDEPFIRGFTPRDNRASRWFNRQVGLKSHGFFEDYEIFIITRQEWNSEWHSA
jgi:hypothetical protein